MTQHTPTPWKQGVITKRLEVQDETGWSIAICVPNPKIQGEAYSNAAFIVRAVNNHEKLVEALEELCAYNGGGNENDALDMRLWREGRAALAAAKGEG